MGVVHQINNLFLKLIQFFLILSNFIIFMLKLCIIKKIISNETKNY
jgi:hypothetical protein